MGVDLKVAWHKACEHAAIVSFLMGKPFDVKIAHREHWKYVRP